jgi:hypothetical protein
MISKHSVSFVYYSGNCWANESCSVWQFPVRVGDRPAELPGTAPDLPLETGFCQALPPRADIFKLSFHLDRKNHYN